MEKHRRNGHAVSLLMVYVVWVAKYRYPVLTGDTQVRCRELLVQMCDAEDVKILKGRSSRRIQEMNFLS